MLPCQGGKKESIVLAAIYAANPLFGLDELKSVYVANGPTNGVQIVRI